MIRPKLPQGLYRRLAAYSVLIAFSFGLVLSLYQILQDYRLQDSRLAKELKDRVSLIEDSAAKAVYEFDENLGALVANSLFDHPTVLEVLIVDDYGDPFVSERRREAAQRPAWLPEQVAFAPRELRYPLIVDSIATEDRAEIRLRVDPYLAIEDFLRRAWLILVTDLLRSVVLALVLLLLSYHLVSRPINSLTERLRRIDPFENPKERLEADARHEDNELGSLTRMINALLERIESGLENIRHLNEELHAEVSDRIQIESAIHYAEQQTAGNTGIEYIEAMASFLGETLSLSGVVVAQVESREGSAGLHFVAGWREGKSFEKKFSPMSRVAEEVERLTDDFRLVNGAEVGADDPFSQHNALVIPLRDHSGNWIGLLALLGERPFDVNFHARNKSLLRICSSRVTTEIEREQQERTIRYVAHTDSLTELPNRYFFLQRVEKVAARIDREGGRLALLHLDLDRFKWVNDSIGHTVGDQLLMQIAARLKAVLDGRGTLFRIGGDEFAILLENPQGGAEHLVAKTIQGAFQEPFRIDNHHIVARTCIGIADFPSGADSAVSLVKNAEIAMYVAKRVPEQTIQFFTGAIDQQLQRKIKIEKSLLEALNDSKLTVAYQPQFDIDDGALSGIEALVRWTDAELGEISPVEFIPIAEETGLIHKLGLWIIERAAVQAREWNRISASPVRVAFNLSPSQLRSQSLMTNLVDTIRETGVDPGLLELEITESTLIEDIDATAALLEELSEVGLNISIDDFGTGYSSLKYLKILPINSLKIDRAFVSGIPSSRSDVNIVLAVIALAKAVNMSVLAEGVETQEQSQFLYEHGCNRVQGYYYARPMPAEEITRLLQNKHRARTPGVIAGMAS